MIVFYEKDVCRNDTVNRNLNLFLRDLGLKNKWFDYFSFFLNLFGLWFNLYYSKL